MKLKTLKDFEARLIEWKESQGFWINLEELRAEAIKWVKEDFELVKNIESHKMLERWKERLNITDEDLEEKEK